MNWWEKYTKEGLADEMSRRSKGKPRKYKNPPGFAAMTPEKRKAASLKGLAKRYGKKVEDYEHN